MATTRATGRESNPVDDEFLQLLYRGGELLAAGKVIEAKDYLERAHKLQPKNEKGQNLLGLTYFKLGLFDRAAELYEMLVRENPVDPTLRVNLGLVYLKTNALQRAVREFEVAVDLAPDHKKAHNYLGLALAQQHEYGRAREHFLLSGSEAMAEKMSRAIAGEGFSRPAPVQPAKARGFAELEGTEVVREQGGEPVSEAPSPSSGGELEIEVVEESPTEQAAPPPPSEPPPSPAAAQTLPAADDDWGAQFGLDEVPPSPPAAPSPEESAEAAFTPEAAAPVEELPVMAAEELAPAAEEAPPVSEAPAPAAEAPAAEETPGAGAEALASEEEFPDILEEEPGSATIATPPPPPPEASVPVMSAEEVSEDGLPVLTAEPEDAEDLAAIAQHEEAPSSAPLEAVAPTEALPEAPYEATSAALEASGSQMLAEPVSEPAPAAEAVPAEAPGEPAAPSEHPASAQAFPPDGAAVPVLGELALALALAGASPESPFTVGTGVFSARVDGELLTRLEGLVAFTGQVSFQPEMRRFRGRPTDTPFGEGPRQMVRASGRGVLFLEPAERRTFLAVDLGEESAYFRDECVFAFEEPVMFENGRVPSDVAADLELVHLRGGGKVLLSLPGPMRTVPVRGDAPVTVPVTHLVGWQGSLTPRVVSLLRGPGGEILKTAVELGGEGFALICLPVR